MLSQMSETPTDAFPEFPKTLQIAVPRCSMKYRQASVCVDCKLAERLRVEVELRPRRSLYLPKFEFRVLDVAAPDIDGSAGRIDDRLMVGIGRDVNSRNCPGHPAID